MRRRRRALRIRTRTRLPRCIAARRAAPGRRRIARRARAAVPAGRTSATRSRKTFRFADYHETIAFVNALAWIAHREDHHPDLGGPLRSLRGRLVDARRRRRDAERLHLRRQDRAAAPGCVARGRRAPCGARRDPRSADGVVVAATGVTSSCGSTTASAVECVLKGRRTTLACGDRVARRARVAARRRHRGGRAAHDAVLSLRRVQGEADRRQRHAGHRRRRARSRASTRSSSIAGSIAAEAEALPLRPRREQGGPAGLRGARARGSRRYAALGYAVVAAVGEARCAPLLPWLAGQHRC